MSQADATVIAEHTSIKGNLKLDGPAVVFGRVEGSIVAEQLEIAPDGDIHGDIDAAVIEIHGSVRGNITASRTCRLGATANVSGQLKVAHLAVAPGAYFIGQVTIGSMPGESAADESNPLQEAEGFAAEFDSATRAVAMAAPASLPPEWRACSLTVASSAASWSSSPALHTPEIRVFPQAALNLTRAPRILKAG